jgi:tetratricopeptide (TPR) repeat protein
MLVSEGSQNQQSRLSREATRTGRGDLLCLTVDVTPDLHPLEEHVYVPAPRPDPPQQLPPSVTPGGQFAGREAELTALSAQLLQGRAAGTVTVCAVCGSAGVGKTALAVHWARKVAPQFPDGQLYVNLRGFDPSRPALSQEDAVTGFLSALGAVPELIPAGLEARLALYQSLLATKRVLLVLDNARDEKQVRALLPADPGCLAIVTSRSRLTGLAGQDGFRLLTLDALDEAEARSLLAANLGPARLAAEPDAAATLIGLCGRLPLALALAAAAARARPQLTLCALSTELRRAAQRLGPPDPGDPGGSVGLVFAWSYQNVSEAAAAMFRVLTLHPGPDVTTPAAASLAGLPALRAGELLAELTRACLLTEPTTGRYAFHDLLRAYAARHAADLDGPSRTEALGRVLDHYLHTAHTAALLINPTRESLRGLVPARPGVMPEPLSGYQQAQAWFDAERHVLLSAVTLAASAGFDVYAWQLPWTLTDFLDWRGDWIDWAAMNSLAMAAATRLGDATALAHASRLVAHNYGKVGDYEKARTCLADCLALCREVGDRQLEGRVYLTLCWLCDQQHNYIEALSYAQQALALFRASGDRMVEAVALNNIGYLHLELGDRRLAHTFCEESLALHREAGLGHHEAVVLDSLGEIEQQMGRHAEALERFQQALALYRQHGDRYREAEALIHVGDSRNVAGEPQQAQDAWQQALAILEDLRHPMASVVRHRLRQQLSPRSAQPSTGPGPAEG